MSFVLRVIISGLCVLVPVEGKDEMLVLLIDTRDAHACDAHARDICKRDTYKRDVHVVHYPMVSINLKDMFTNGVGERGGSSVTADTFGDEVANFDLHRELVTIGDGSHLSSLKPSRGAFLGQDRPRFFLPDREDLRWVVESERFMGKGYGRIRRESVTYPWCGVIAAIRLTAGEVKSLSIVKRTDGGDIVWDFPSPSSQEKILHSQALADKIVVDIPISGSDIQFSSLSLDNHDHDKLLPFPKLRPRILGEIVEISITNLPLKRFTGYSGEDSHFSLLCELAEYPDRCVAPNIRDSGTGAGSGVICPMLMFQP